MTHFDHLEAAATGPRFVHSQRTTEFQSALLGMAGHDLRQPLQVIQSTYDWFELGAGSPNEKALLKRGERALARITEQLDRLIGALRLHEHMREIEVAPVVLFPALLKLSMDCADQAEQKDIKLKLCPSSMSVMTNAVLFDGILRNLVQNAIKYTQPSSRILIGCRRLGKQARIDVVDTGIGIPAEHLRRIFLAFERLDTSRNDGLGIGLYVASRAAEFLGHKMEVRSTIGQGSRFSVIVPCCEAAKQDSVTSQK